MNLHRRDWLKLAGAGVALAACGPSKPNVQSPTSPSASAKTSAQGTGKRILILGGTGFVGPSLVAAARARGHTLTLFNRGKSHPGLFPDVETILGDRITQLDLLKGRDWDAVIDTWGPGPTLVTRAAEMLRDHVGHYVFVSTISTYVLGKTPIDETSPVLSLPPGVSVKDIKKIDLTVYGPLKVLAEQAAEAAMPGRTTSIRSGLIAGPNDPTDRFTYWPLRMARGGEMIAPGSRDDRLQFVDVRDLGDWMVTVVEQKTMGTFNCVGPTDPKLGSVLDEVRLGVSSDVKMTWLDQAFLDQNKAGGWDDFPGAVPMGADDAGFGQVSAARALAKGFRPRAPRETAKDTLAWWNTLPEERRKAQQGGISAAREAELLALWHKAKG